MARLDASVQLRIESQVLATLAKFYYEKGNMGALKGASALVRQAVYGAMEVALSEGAELVTPHMAVDTLARLGVLPAISPTALGHNLVEESKAAEPQGRVTTPRSKPQKVHNIEGRPYTEEQLERAIKAAALSMAAPVVNEAQKGVRQLHDDDLADGEATSEADEGEFKLEELRNEKKGSSTNN